MHDLSAGRAAVQLLRALEERVGAEPDFEKELEKLHFLRKYSVNADS